MVGTLPQAASSFAANGAPDLTSAADALCGNCEASPGKGLEIAGRRSTTTRAEGVFCASAANNRPHGEYGPGSAGVHEPSPRRVCTTTFFTRTARGGAAGGASRGS